MEVAIIRIVDVTILVADLYETTRAVLCFLFFFQAKKYLIIFFVKCSSIIRVKECSYWLRGSGSDKCQHELYANVMLQKALLVK